MNIEVLATKVSNDISEGIDNKETRSQLREVVAWWANLACENITARHVAERKLSMMKPTVKLLATLMEGVE